MVCGSAACSTARNGPTSLPLGLMTPIVAARTRTGSDARGGEDHARQDHQQRAGQEHAAPPDRSACVVSQSEIAASPSERERQEQADRPASGRPRAAR